MTAAWLAVNLAGAVTHGEETVAEGPRLSLGVEELRLDNGFTLLLVERPEAPEVAAGWVVRSGSADDPPDRRGLAHLLEHVLFHGTRLVGTRDYSAESAALVEAAELRQEIDRLRTRGRRSARRIAELESELAHVEGRLSRLAMPGELALLYSRAGGSGLNAFTFEDFTMFFVRLPPGRLDLWFWLESDRLNQPVFRHFDKEKGIVRQEVAQRIESAPTGSADEALRATFWGSSSYAWRPLGRVSDLEAVERSDAEAFFQRHYTPDRVTAVLVGPFDRNRARALATEYFGSLPRRGAGPPDPSRRTAPPPEGERPDFETVCDCPTQTRVRYPTVPFRHPDSYALQVLAAVLNGTSGRLHRSLVIDRQMAVQASATQLSYRGAGSFLFAAETKAGTKPEQLLAAWDEELARLTREPVTEDELERVKNQLVANSLRALRRPGDLARQLLVYSGLGEWRQIEDWPRRVAQVDAEALRRVAKSLTPGTRLVAYYRSSLQESAPR